MASGGKVGSAYVEVSPKAAGNFKALIERQMPSGGDGGTRFGGGFSKGMTSSISAGAVAVGNILSDIAKAGASAAKDFIGEALGSAADYEQLSGGMDTLFKGSADKMRGYAQDAFAAAQMSANDYMQLSTDFAASMIASVGGDTSKAADLTNQAVMDMADNANKMGTSMADIENAYKGFSKQNYTMLDNLKLGYGGTKEEMQRLLDHASTLEGAMGKTFDISNFADVTEAIHLVQEEMGMAGVSMDEALSTVSGSINMTKAAWDNWVTGLGSDGADMSKLTENLVTSAEAMGENVVPRLSQIFDSISTALPGLIAGLVPVLVPEIGNLITSAVNLVGTLATDTLPQVLPMLISAATSLVTSLLPTIAGMLPSLLQASITLFMGLVQAFNQVTPQVISMLPGLVSQAAQMLLANAPQMLSSGISLFLNVAMALVQAAPQILSTIMAVLPLFAQQVMAAAPQMLEGGKQLFNALGQALAEVVPMLADALWYVITHLPEIVVNGVGAMIDAGGQLLGSLVDGFMGKEPQVEQAAGDAAAGAADAALANSDASAAAANLTASMSQFDFGSAEQAASVGAADVAAAAAQAADGAPVSQSFTQTTVAALDLTAMNQPATDMINNAMQAAKSIDVSSIGAEFCTKAATGMDTSAMSSKAAEMAAEAAKLNQTATVSVNADLSGVNALKAAAASVSQSFNSMSSTVASAMSRASSSAKSAASSISSSISSGMQKASSAASTAASEIKTSINSIPSSKTITFSFSKPHIPVPHYSVSGSLDPKSGSVPSVSAWWGAEGGILTKATIFGAGEAGPEAVLPLSKLPGLLGLDGRGGGDEVTINLNYVDGSADAQQMMRDIAREYRRYRMAGAF